MTTWLHLCCYKRFFHIGSYYLIHVLWTFTPDNKIHMIKFPNDALFTGFAGYSAWYKSRCTEANNFRARNFVSGISFIMFFGRCVSICFHHVVWLLYLSQADVHFWWFLNDSCQSVFLLYCCKSPGNYCGLLAFLISGKLSSIYAAWHKWSKYVDVPLSFKW